MTYFFTSNFNPPSIKLSIYHLLIRLGAGRNEFKPIFTESFSNGPIISVRFDKTNNYRFPYRLSSNYKKRIPLKDLLTPIPFKPLLSRVEIFKFLEIFGSDILLNQNCLDFFDFIELLYERYGEKFRGTIWRTPNLYFFDVYSIASIPRTSLIQQSSLYELIYNLKFKIHFVFSPEIDESKKIHYFDLQRLELIPIIDLKEPPPFVEASTFHTKPKNLIPLEEI